MPFVGGGGSPQGSLRWIAQLDVTQFKQGTATLKTEITGVGQVAKQASTAGINPLNQAFNPLSATMQKTTQGMNQVNKSTITMNSAFNAGLSPIQNSGNAMNQLVTSQGKMITSTNQAGTSLTKVGGVMKNNLAAVGLLAGGIAGLDDQYLQLHKAQVAEERASLMVDKVHQRIAKTQKALNDMRAKGLEGTEEYTLKQRDLTLAQEQAGVMQERLVITQENLSEATEDFWVGIIPNALFIGGSAAQLIKEMGINMNSLRGIVPRLGGAVTALGGAFSSMFQAISKVNWLSLISSIASVAVPILATIAAIWLLVGAYQGLSNVSQTIIEMNNLQVESLNPLQLAWLKLQDTLAGMGLAEKLTAKQKHDLEEYDKITFKKLDEMVAKAKEKGANLGNEFTKGFTTLPPEVINTIKNIGGQLGEAFSGVGSKAIESADDMDVFTDSAYALGNGITFASGAMLAQLSAADQHNEKINQQIELYNRLYPTGEKARTQTHDQAMTHIDLNKALIEEAKSLGFTEEELSNLTYKSGQMSFQTQENNVRLQDIINTLDSYNPRLGTAAQSSEDVVNQLEPWAKGFSQVNDIMNVTNSVLGTNTEMLPEWTQMQVDSTNEAAKAWAEFATEFNKATALKGVLKIESEADDLTKELFKDMPKGLERKVKLGLEFDQKWSDLRTAFSNVSQGLLVAGPSGEMQLKFGFNKENATKTLKEWKEELDKQIKKAMDKGLPIDPALADLRAKIGLALEDGVTDSEWLDILDDMAEQIDPIPVYIVDDPDSASDIHTNIQKYLDGQTLSATAKANIDEITDGTGSVDIFNEAGSPAGFGNLGTGKSGSTKPVGSVFVEAKILPISTSTIPFEPFPKEDLENPPGGRDEQGRPLDRQGNVIKTEPKQDFSQMFSAVTTAAQKAQTAIANLANQGSNSMSLLAKNAGVHTKTMNTYLNITIPVAAQHSQTGIANLANQGSNSMSILAKASSKQVSGMVNNLNKGYEAAGHLQEGLANLANEGAKSLKALAKASSTSMNGFINNLEAGQDEVSNLISAIKKIPKNVNVHYSSTGSTAEKHAEGGIISAASGIVARANGPRLVMIGDNPGGDEIMAAFPRNNPWPTMEKVLGYIQGGGQHGQADFAIGARSNIGIGSSGGDIHITNVIYDYEIQRRYSMRQGTTNGRYGG